MFAGVYFTSYYTFWMCGRVPTRYIGLVVRPQARAKPIKYLRYRAATRPLMPPQSEAQRTRANQQTPHAHITTSRENYTMARYDRTLCINYDFHSSATPLLADTFATTRRPFAVCDERATYNKLFYYTHNTTRSNRAYRNSSLA